MRRRYLYGPVTADHAESLRKDRQDGVCVTFGPAAPADLPLAADDNWDAILAHCPTDWRPEFLVVQMEERVVPPWLWSAPVPLIALAPGWQRQWHAYRRLLGACELILTDPAGVDACTRAGLSQARAALLCGCRPEFWDGTDGPRDIDLLFCDDLHPTVHRLRLPWLARLAPLSKRWNVVIRTGVPDAEYRDLFRRARIVFNHSNAGAANGRAFEAVAAGALLFQEATHRQLPEILTDRLECIYYGTENLDALLEHYLEHEEERAALARAAQEKVRHLQVADLWDRTLATVVEPEWERMHERLQRRTRLTGAALLEARSWQAVTSPEDDPTLVRDLADALGKEPHDANLYNALGVAVTRAAQGHGPTTGTLAGRAVACFQQAADVAPDHPLVALNFAESLVGFGQRQEAIAQARRALALCVDPKPLRPEYLEAGHFPPMLDLFRIEWERAAWAHAGQPAAEEQAKRAVLLWRLHFLLAELTGDLRHYYEAVLARPDLSVTRAMLGCALGRTGQPAEAIPHLQAALADDPLDAEAARALYRALGETGAWPGQRRLARTRRLLAQAIPQAVQPEDWFAAEAPAGDELVSILILCCNELPYTQHCLESLWRHTRAPYELILVDNGSTDGTPAYLEEVRKRPGPERVVVLRNDTNRGYAAGNNQALAAARGEYVVFLNNDTVLTAGWLEGLIGWMLSDWPHFGMVGPVTNYSRPPQQVPVDYAGLADVPAFAARRRQTYARHALVVERLAGFCLLAHRAALERIGTLDERFGLGFFEDDDLCVRALDAGYRLLLAQDVFIHHFGSRTFAGLGIDCQEQLRDNFERFRAKWGPAQTGGYRLPGPAPAVPAPPVLAAGGRVSLCLIVRNEEANIGDCLQGAADLVDEVIVVDTGSTDRTKEIAVQAGATVVDFPWIDSFAAARNETLRQATGDWIFWLDADDRLDTENGVKLRTLFGQLPAGNVAYAMKCLCLPDPISGTATVVDHIRLFRRLPGLSWRYRVHEQILPALREQGVEVRWSDVVIRHTGYQDPALRGRKLERDLRLLDLENKDRPDDPFTLFNLGSVYQELGRYAEALPLLARSLERSAPSDSIVRKLFALTVHCQRQLGRRYEALAACQEGRKHFPDDAELLFHEGGIRCEMNDHGMAEALFLRLLGGQEAAHFASVDTGLRGYKARHNLAVVYIKQQRWAEAERLWHEALAEQPGFIPAWLGLGDVLMQQRRWPELEDLMQKLGQRSDGALESAILRSRAHLAREEFTSAIQLLERSIDTYPRELWLRRLLTHALLQQNRNWAAAEQALRNLLALAPGDAEAQRNLDTLMRQQGRYVLEP